MDRVPDLAEPDIGHAGAAAEILWPGRSFSITFWRAVQSIAAVGRVAERGAAPMSPCLRVLIVEHSEFDAQMLVSILRKAGYEVIFERVESAAALQAALSANSWDLVLADSNLPEFNAPAALKILQDSGLDLPFIIVSGGIGEDIAVSAMKAGAHDYLMKGNLSRLAPAVERELREAANRTSQRAAKRALQESGQHYRLLLGTSPDAVILLDTGSAAQLPEPAAERNFE